MKKSNVYVTKPTLPPLEELLPYLYKIWDRKILTNGGEFHQNPEKELCSYLGVSYLSLCTNATLGLMLALEALDVKGEVITTPYSFVATSHSLKWKNIEPVFCDVDPKTLNLDPKKIEAAISAHTTAIMPVHCYGYPCDLDQIEKIASKHGLKVIYDAAHAFGVKYRGESILKSGDISVLSFHATKVFNTFEGGAIICQNAETKRRIDQLKNFGFVDETTVVGSGINGKMSEFNAALGLLQLNYIDGAIDKRMHIDSAYRKNLKNIKGIKCLLNPEGSTANFSYFPILVGQEFPISRDKLYEYLREYGFQVRRYFYPLISHFPLYKDLYSSRPENLKNAEMLSQQILCLPIYPDLEISSIEEIAYLMSKI